MQNHRQPSLTATPQITCYVSIAIIAIVLATQLLVSPGCASPLAEVSTAPTGKTYVAVQNGSGYSPYLMYGVQLRIDQLIGNTYNTTSSWPSSDQTTSPPTSSPDYYFYEAQQTGFKTVVVPVWWSYVNYTTAYGATPTYNFQYIDRILQAAANFNLNVQLLWYGSDVCGGCTDAPQYVLGDHTHYPVISEYNSPNTYTYLNLSSSNLINAESGALVAAMNHVAQSRFASSVIMLQVENEPDGNGGQPLTWGNQSEMNGEMFNGGQFSAVSNLINTLAANVKASSGWTGLTRVNIGSSYRSIDLANGRNSYPYGVDLFGVDLYTSTLTSSSQASVHNDLAQLTPSSIYGELATPIYIDPLTSNTGASLQYENNVSYQPEGGGQYGNYISLVLSNFQDGGGALIYELRTLQGWQSNGVWQPVYDLGIFRRTTSQAETTWTPRDGSQTTPYNLDGTNWKTESNTASITTFNQTIYQAAQDIALATPYTCAAFNLAGNAAAGSPETHTVDPVNQWQITYTNWNNAQAFAMEDASGNLILLNFTAGNSFTIDSRFPHGTTASVGYFDSNNNWVQQYTKNFNTGTNTLLCWQGECVLVKHT